MLMNKKDSKISFKLTLDSVIFFYLLKNPILPLLLVSKFEDKNCQKPALESVTKYFCSSLKKLKAVQRVQFTYFF